MVILYRKQATWYSLNLRGREALQGLITATKPVWKVLRITNEKLLTDYI